jgi:hypothetical protein
LIIFAEIFKDYLFILAWFSVRLPLFSYDLKTIFVFWLVFWERLCVILSIFVRALYLYFDLQLLGTLSVIKEEKGRGYDYGKQHTSVVICDTVIPNRLPKSVKRYRWWLKLSTIIHWFSSVYCNRFGITVSQMTTDVCCLP